MKFIAGKGLIKPLPFITAAVCLVVAVVFMVYDKAPQQLPPGIVGRWFSADPRYEACFMNISPDSLLIRGADGKIYRYALEAVREEATADRRRGRFYNLLSADEEGAELEFRFFYDAEAGILSYANQPDVVWFKSPGKEEDT